MWTVTTLTHALPHFSLALRPSRLDNRSVSNLSFPHRRGPQYNMYSQSRRFTAVDFSKAQGEAPPHDTPDEQLQRSSSPGRNLPLGNSPIRSSKKRYRASDDEEDPIATAEIVKAQAYKRNLPPDFQVRMGSPWDSYTKVLNVEHLDNSITVAERTAPHSGLVAIKVFPSAVAEKALERHQRVTHENIVDVLDAFTTDTSLYIVLEHLPISLLQIVEGAKYPSELQLAAILKQVRFFMSGAVHLLTQHVRSSAV